jgi:DNA (cytosine-5)-methyltransferase 1
MKHKYDDNNLFNWQHDKVDKVDRLKVGTFFSGIGAPEKGLGNIGIDFELMFFSEIDKYAKQSYCAIHNESIDKCIGSITDVKGENLPYCDMWFGGFPCQDISLAGNQKGFAFESETRSSLGWEMIRLLREVEKKPKYVIFENVAAITFQTNAPILKLFKDDLKELGYSVYDKLLNSKDYGIPQNRNRYFLVAILGEYKYYFPRKRKLKLRLKDMLETNVSEKYYLNDKQITYTLGNAANKELKDQINREDMYFNKNVAYTINTKQDRRIGDANFIIEEIDEQVKVKDFLKIPEATKQGYAIATEGDGVYINRPHQKRGVVQKDMIPTLKTSADDLGVVDNLRIRKLTPKECFRLQGFTDTDYENAAMCVSNSQLYKQAGNSITVQVLEAIFTNLFKGGNL